MINSTQKSDPESGLTLIEVTITAGTLTILMLSSLTAVLTSQDAVIQNQTISQLQARGQMAMDRIVELSSRAVTGDEQFSPLKPTTGVNSHGLRFREIDSIDGVSGEPVYNDDLRVYVYGPDNGTNPCDGLIIGHGPTLADIYTSGSGPDGRLGTVDDNAAPISGGVPAVELLIPDTFAPRTGEMFTVNVTPAPIGRFLTYTLRLNARGSDGDFVRWNDLVITTSVSLRQ